MSIKNTDDADPFRGGGGLFLASFKSATSTFCFIVGESAYCEHINFANDTFQWYRFFYQLSFIFAAIKI